jgi:hypothetical protein
MPNGDVFAYRPIYMRGLADEGCLYSRGKINK